MASRASRPSTTARAERIDVPLGPAALAQRVTGAEIDRQERKGKGASDHAPVVVELGGRARPVRLGTMRAAHELVQHTLELYRDRGTRS